MSIPVSIQKVASDVKTLFNQNQNPALLYHNIGHTEYVVRKTFEIASTYSLNENEIFILLTSAWFHDTGHLFGRPEFHEERSVLIMKDYLENENVDKKTIAGIAGCIMATKIPQEPKTLLEQIICDADTFNLGTKEFVYTDSQLKKEFQLRDAIPAIGWNRSTLNMLMKHRYFTPYCQALLNKGKEENIEMVSKKIKEGLK